jgi:transposase
MMFVNMVKQFKKMETIGKLYFGVDVGCQELVISQGVQTASPKFIKLPTEKVSNEVSSIDVWVASLPANAHIIFESTGNYSLPLAYCLELAEIPFSILTPAQSKGFAQTMKVSHQNDEVDACLLALYGANYRPDNSVLESETLHQLKQKRKHLSSLMSQKGAVDNQLHALSFDKKADPKVLKSLTLIQQTLQIQIKEFTDEIFTLTQQEYQHIYQLMTSIVGIGEKSANSIIIATNGLENFQNPKQLVKFFGLAPRIKESGKSVNQKFGIGKSGVGFVRATLYNAAKAAKRFNLACKELYERLRSKGKCHKVAMVAVMAKLVRQVFAVVKSNTIFDNKFEVAK